MPKGPKVKLTFDLHKIDRFFPVNFESGEGFDYELIITRERYDEVESLLHGYHLDNDQIIQEFCFILLWIQKETQAVEDPENYSGKLYQMWLELDNLKQYLMNHRITSISLHGEFERNRPGKTMVLKEEINIDRLCDGIRTVFREEFLNDKLRRRTKGQRAWQKRKMVRVSNNILNYFTSIPELDELSLEEQKELISRLAVMAGLAEI
jgi:hypothetical protein